jgi:hypothetical protein
MVKVDDGGFRCLMQDKRLPVVLVWIVLHVDGVGDGVSICRPCPRPCSNESWERTDRSLGMHVSNVLGPLLTFAVSILLFLCFLLHMAT